jgi:hypothetical protein
VRQRPLREVLRGLAPLGDVVGGLRGPLVLVRLDLGQGPAEREPPRTRRPKEQAGCAYVGFGRSRTLAVPEAEAGLLAGAARPRPTDMAPTPTSHIW